MSIGVQCIQAMLVTVCVAPRRHVRSEEWHLERTVGHLLLYVDLEELANPSMLSEQIQRLQHSIPHVLCAFRRNINQHGIQMTIHQAGC